jgi:hypothetical protein
MCFILYLKGRCATIGNTASLHYNIVCLHATWLTKIIKHVDLYSCLVLGHYLHGHFEILAHILPNRGTYAAFDDVSSRFDVPLLVVIDCDVTSGETIL